MGMIDDIRKWLKEIPIWRELEKVPGRMDALEEKVRALEARLERSPGETCDNCGEHTLRRTAVGRVVGTMGKQERHDTWTCEACGASEVRTVKL